MSPEISPEPVIDLKTLKIVCIPTSQCLMKCGIKCLYTCTCAVLSQRVLHRIVAKVAGCTVHWRSRP